MSEYVAPWGHFLAVVKFLKPDIPNRFARLRPIYQIDDLRWQSVRDGDARFLDDGLVFWWQPPSNAIEGTLWVITLEPQPKYGFDPRSYRDKCQVAKASCPYQAMALYGVKGPRAFRRALASGRLSFDVPIVGRPLVRVASEVGHWVALPEGLIPSTEDGRTSLTATGLAGILPLYDLDADSFEQVIVDGHRYSLRLDLGVPAGYQCALSDAQLIEHLRKQISTRDRPALDAIGVTKNLLRLYVETIEAAGLGGDEAAKEEARRDAADTLIEGLDAEAAHIDETVDLLMAHPRVSEALAARAEEDLRGIRERWQRESAEEHRQASEALDTLRHEITTGTIELDALHAAIAAAVAEILEAPVGALARHGLLDSLRQCLPTRTDRQSEGSPIVAAMPAYPTRSALEMVTDIDRLKETVTAWAYGTGVDPYVLQVGLAAILAHRITLLSGANAERLAVALASTVAGDRAVRVSVGTAVFGLADLMCAPIAPIGSTRIDGVPMLGAFLAAQSPEDIVIVVLSGCNRAPPEVVLPEFLPPLRDGPTRLAWSNRDGSIATAMLSPRVRFIGTLHGGTATYRISHELGAQLGLVPADYRELTEFTMPEAPLPPPVRIDSVMLDVLQTLPVAADIAEQATWLSAHGVALPPPALMRILATYLNLLCNPQKAAAEALAGMLLGRTHGPDLTDLPGAHTELIQQRLHDLAETRAWLEARQHFTLGDER